MFVTRVCIRLPLFCFCVGSSSTRCWCSFSSIISLSAEQWVWQCGSLSLLLLVWQMYLCLARSWRLAICPVLQLSLLSHSLFLLAHQDAKGRHSKISAPPSRWQQECCTYGCRAAVRSSRVWQQGLSSPAPSLPPPNRCSEDGGAYTDGSLPVIQTSVIFVH